MNKTFFIADTHFGHANVIWYSNRPFQNIQEHDEALIKNWNRVVKGDARVFMLGDFALTGKDKIIKIVQKLNGRKILIAGNHDGASAKTYYQAGFETVIKYPIIFGDFLLSHMPQEKVGSFINIHGHVHEKQGILRNMANYFCVSVENINYTPIELGELNEKIQEKKEKINEHILP